jgi:hypothetical protein
MTRTSNSSTEKTTVQQRSNYLIPPPSNSKSSEPPSSPVYSKQSEKTGVYPYPYKYSKYPIYVFKILRKRGKLGMIGGWELFSPTRKLDSRWFMVYLIG